MNFYETQMGKNFFEVQLPRLIQVLEDISVSLSQKTESVTLPIAIPENFLEESEPVPEKHVQIII